MQCDGSWNSLRRLAPDASCFLLILGVLPAVTRVASLWICGFRGQWPAAVPAAVPPTVILQRFAKQSYEKYDKQSKTFQLKLSRIIPWQKTPDMLCSWAAADTGMASPAKCIQTHEPKIHAVPKNGAVGGHFATV